MTVLLWLGVIVGVIAIIWGVLWLNEYSWDEYRYKPFNATNLVVSGLVWVALYVSGLFVPEGEDPLKVWQMVKEDLSSITGPYLDVLVAQLIAIVLLLGLFIRMTLKTNVVIAFLALVIQVIASLIIFLITILLAGAFNDKKKRRRRYR